MLENIMQNEIVQGVIIAVVTGLIGLIGTFLTLAIKNANEWLNLNVKNEYAKTASKKLMEKISAYILEIYKLGSEDLKQKIKDGKLTDKEKAEWKQNLINFAKLQGESELNILKLAGEDINNTIKLYAEVAWADIKKKLLEI